MDFKLNIDYSVLLECGVSPELILNGETTSYNVNVTGMTEDVSTVEVYDENVNTPVNLEEENYCIEDAVRNCFCGILGTIGIVITPIIFKIFNFFLLHRHSHHTPYTD